MTRTLSFGGGVQTAYLLFKHWNRYDYIVHADVSNGDRLHGEHAVTYHILDNLVKPFCEEKKLPLKILTHKEGGLWQRSIIKKWLPMMYPRWCTQDHKIEVIRQFIRKELKADYPNNIVHTDIGFSFDEVLRIGQATRKRRYNQEEYPLIDMKIKRQECVDWLNKNHPFEFNTVVNNNKITINDWKDAKSGCWFCPFWPKEKLLQLSDWQKQEMINLEEATKNNIKWKVDIPFKSYLNMDKHKLDEYMEVTEDVACTSGHCFL